jgi:hypothetical protein
MRLDLEQFISEFSSEKIDFLRKETLNIKMNKNKLFLFLKTHLLYRGGGSVLILLLIAAEWNYNSSLRVSGF